MLKTPTSPLTKRAFWRCAYDRIGAFINPTDGSDPNNSNFTRAEPYINHQRVAAAGRKSRVLLAGDALHSSNPIGGLGLPSGICDAFCCGNVLVRVIAGGEGDELLARVAGRGGGRGLMRRAC